MQKLIYCIGLTVCFIGLLSLSNHTLYIAQVNVKNLPQSRRTTIEIKVFADDLRDALQSRFPKQQFIANETLNEQQKYLTKYITTHFYCKINQKKRKLVFQSCVFKDGMYNLSFNCRTPKDWSSIKIKANFLMELFPKQSNIISLNYNEEKWFERLKKGKETVEWKIK